MKKVLIALIILALLAAGWYVWQNNDTPTDSLGEEEIIETEQMTGDTDIIDLDTPMPEAVVLDEDGEPIAEDMDAVNADIIQRLEAQAEIGMDGEELTDEDIRLIQEILDAITSGAQAE